MKLVKVRHWAGSPNDWVYDEENNILFIPDCSELTQEVIDEIQKNKMSM